jgi:hypothetical protein
VVQWGIPDAAAAVRPPVLSVLLVVVQQALPQLDYQSMGVDVGRIWKPCDPTALGPLDAIMKIVVALVLVVFNQRPRDSQSLCSELGNSRKMEMMENSIRANDRKRWYLGIAAIRCETTVQNATTTYHSIELSPEFVRHLCSVVLYCESQSAWSPTAHHVRDAFKPVYEPLYRVRFRDLMGLPRRKM